MQLDFDKKLAQMQIKHQEQLGLAKQQLNEAEAQNDLKDMIANHKRDVQSMLDKHKTNVEMCLAKSEKEEKGTTIINQMPDGNKSIRIEREGGLISGAEIV